MTDASGNNDGLSRRDILRLMEIAAGVISFPLLPGCESVWERQAVIPVEHWNKGVCLAFFSIKHARCFTHR